MTRNIGMYRCWSLNGIQDGNEYQYVLDRSTPCWDYFEEPVVVQIPDGYEPAESMDGRMRLYGPNGCVHHMLGTKPAWTDNGNIVLCDGGSAMARVIAAATEADNDLFVRKDAFDMTCDPSDPLSLHDVSVADHGRGM